MCIYVCSMVWGVMVSKFWGGGSCFPNFVLQIKSEGYVAPGVSALLLVLFFTDVFLL